MPERPSVDTIPLIARVADKTFVSLAWILGGAGALLPIGILGFLAWHGLRVVDWNFLTTAPAGFPLGLKGGIRPAIEGSIALVLIGLAVSLPIAVGGAIYMAEYGRTRPFLKALRFGAECLAAIPSIVYGLFGYAFLVVFLSLKVSLLAGGITLGFVMFPVILIGAQEAIEAVEVDLRESSLALGVTRAYTLRKIILVKAWPGIIAITVISAGHAFGSAAPILYTASVIYSRWSLDLSSPVMTLPTHLYYLLSEALSFQHAFGTAFVLVAVLLTANIMAMLLKKLVRR